MVRVSLIGALSMFRLLRLAMKLGLSVIGMKFVLVELVVRAIIGVNTPMTLQIDLNSITRVPAFHGCFDV